MANLNRQLAEWLEQGLLTGEQAAAIAAYEAARPSGRWAYLAFLGLGAAAVGIGLISLVAANWGDIPDLLKLAAAFAGLLLLTWGAWRQLAQGGETLLAIHLFASMACMGLIAQVYHTGGKLEDALLFWSLITLLPTTLARGRLVPMLWLTIFTGSLLFWLTESHWITHDLRETMAFGVVFALPYLFLGLAVLLSQGEGGFGWAARRWLVLSGLLAVGFGDGLLTEGSWHVFEPQAYGPSLVLAAVTLGYVGLRQRGIVRLLAMAVVGGQMAQLVLNLMMSRAPMVSFLVTMAVVALAACLAAVLGQQRLFNGLMVLLGLRLLVAYFLAMGGLALTAFGLILTGLLILGTVVVWRRQRHRVHAWLEDLR